MFILYCLGRLGLATNGGQHPNTSGPGGSVTSREEATGPALVGYSCSPAGRLERKQPARAVPGERSGPLLGCCTWQAAA